MTQIEKIDFDFKDEAVLGDNIVDIISIARGEKTNNNVSLKTPIKTLNISVYSKLKEAIEEAILDFKATLFIENLNVEETESSFEVKSIILDLEDNDN